VPARIPIGLIALAAAAALACGPSTVLEFAIEGTSDGGDSEGDSSNDDGDDVLPRFDIPVPGTFVRNATLPGGEPIELEIQAGVIVNIGASLPEPPASANQVDLAGAYISPAFIDSHAYLAPLFGSDEVGEGQAELAAGGVVGGVDLAAPISNLPQYSGNWLGAGPMIGANESLFNVPGVATPITTPGDATAAVDLAFEAGAQVISVEVNLSVTDPALAALVERAHEYGLPVVARVLDPDDLSRVSNAGVDVLSTVPPVPISQTDLEYWGSRVVIAQQAQWGGDFFALENLRLLREEGATILYGSALGLINGSGIDEFELLLMSSAGLSRQEIIDAGTVNPAEVWGLDVGILGAGRPATFLVLARDPLTDELSLAEPIAVWVDGAPI